MDIRGIRALTRFVSGLFFQAAVMSLCLVPATASTRQGEDLFTVRSSSILDHLLVRGVAADLDGDAYPDIAVSRPDGASSSGYRYRVDVRLSTYPSSTFFVVSAEAAYGIEITPRDVDGDRDLDLVIRAEGSHRPIAVWINDGAGGFSEGSLDDYATEPWSDTSISVSYRAILSEFPQLRNESPIRIWRPGDGQPVLVLTQDCWMPSLAAPPAPATLRNRGRAPPVRSQLA